MNVTRTLQFCKILLCWTRHDMDTPYPISQTHAIQKWKQCVIVVKKGITGKDTSNGSIMEEQEVVYFLTVIQMPYAAFNQSQELQFHASFSN